MSPTGPIVRVEHSTTEQMKSAGRIDIEPCPPYLHGLSKIKVANIDELLKCTRKSKCVSTSDTLWLGSKICLQNDEVKGWNGFMMNVTHGLLYNVSAIIYLPFINKAPGHYDTIYTALQYLFSIIQMDKHQCL